MKKVHGLLAALLAVLLLATFAGCGQAGSSSTPADEASQAAQASSTPGDATDEGTAEGKTIKWLHHYGEESTRQWVEAITALYTEQTGVTFDIQAVSYDDYQTLLKTKIASGDAPDLFDLTPADLPQFTENNYLADVGEGEFWSNLLDGVKESTAVDGTNYFIPLEANASAAYYNQDVFEAAGITEMPETYQDFIDVLKALQDHGVVPIAFGAQERWTITNDYRADMLQQVLRNDADWMVKLESRDATFADDATFVETLSKFEERHQYGNDDQFGTDWNRATEMVATGQAGMVINGSWSIGAIKEKNPDANIGAFPVPATDDPGETLLTTWSSGGFVVYEESPVKDEVFDFLKVLTGQESGIIWQDDAMRLSVIKGLPDAADPALAEISRYMNEGKTFDVSAMQNEFTGEYWDANVDVLTEYLMGQVGDAQAAAARMDERFDEIAAK